MAMEEPEKGNTIFLSNLFDDTLDLLLEAHDYFESGEGDDDTDDAHYQALHAKEISRITLRMSSVMAWLMIQKAVFMGKVSRQDVNNSRDFQTSTICLEENEEAREFLPAYMNYLLDESLLLYQRIARLDALAHAQQG